MLKKFLLVLSLIILSLFGLNHMYYYNGDYYIPSTKETSCISKSIGKDLYLKENNEYKVFNMKGVNVGMGHPGHFAPELATPKEDYLRWFQQIQDLGANTIRIYTIGSPAFYEALYDYNINNSTPLYLIQGINIDEKLMTSSYSAYDNEFYGPFFDTCKNAIDIIHGRHKIHTKESLTPITYEKDVSPWIYNYILGPEWDVSLIEYTNSSLPQAKQFNGTYLYTSDANNFEIFLTGIANAMITYETEKYANQHTIAFPSGPFTDPFDYHEKIRSSFNKNAKFNIEHIYSHSTFMGGLYTAYNVYPYFPEFVHYEKGGRKTPNTYQTYLNRLVEFHTYPVVISEFGIPTSRGRASFEENRKLSRDQGRVSEKKQGEALISMCKDIDKADCAGKIVFNWQDEWFKNSWNTAQFINTESLPYWHNIQNNAQCFGLLSFEPGKKKSTCYVDGDNREWTKKDLVIDSDKYQLSMKYDFRNIYFLVKTSSFNFSKNKLYLAIDTTPKTGSKVVKQFNLKTEKNSDFILEINGKKNSRLWVQDRYNIPNIVYSNQIRPLTELTNIVPEKESTNFEKIPMVLREYSYFKDDKPISFQRYNPNNPAHYYALIKTHETGKLTYGNSNPKSKNFNSLADFCAGDGFVEIRLPWQLLNFADPSEMLIHDDYYKNHGVKYLQIDHINVGAGDGSSTIEMVPFALEPLGKNPEYHERLKQSYYILQDYWTK